MLVLLRMHVGEVARGNNSWSDTAPNSLRVQNSRRKVSLNSSVGRRSVVQTVDMSPAPAAGMTSDRSPGNVWQKALGEVLVLVVGPGWLGVPWTALRPSGGFLAPW